MTTIEFQAVTICQPYPFLILAPPDSLHRNDVRKRCENRTWGTSHRGPLAIHAGKSEKWLRPGDRADYGDRLVFGAVVGIVEMVGCIQLAMGRTYPGFEWLKTHVHATGPWCWIFENPQMLREPFPVRGRQGFWPVEIPEDLLP